MRIDRDAMDRGSLMDRTGEAIAYVSLASILDTSSDIIARLRIDHDVAGYLDTNSSIQATPILPLAGYMDTSSDVAARLQLINYLSANPDTDSDIAARLQITHLLEVPSYNSVETGWGRNQLDRAGLDRRYTRTTAAVAHGTNSDLVATLALSLNFTAEIDTDSDLAARLRIDHLMSSYVDNDSSITAALLLALASYIANNSDVYARLQIGHNCVAEVDTDSDIAARLQITSLMQSIIDTDSDIAARLQIDHNLSSDNSTLSDLEAEFRKIGSFTFTFSGELAAGETLCIDGDKFTVKKDGVNAIADFSGEFPSIFPGSNWVIYSDDEGSRTIKLTVTKSDRKV